MQVFGCKTGHLDYETEKAETPNLSERESSNQILIQSDRDERMKYRTKLVVIHLVFLILIVYLFTGGCLEQSSGLNGKNGTETTEEANNSSLPNLYNDVQETVVTTEEVDNNQSSSTGRLKTEAINLSNFEAGNSSLTENYRLEAVDIDLKAPSYELPLKKDEISNYGNFSSKISLSKSDLKLLERNGFVVIKNPYNPREEDITSMYSTLQKEEIPVFITTDSLLHLYHIQFDETLRLTEEREFYDTLWKIDLALLNASIEKYNSASGDEKEAARRNTAYFSVALSLLQPKFSEDTARQHRFEVPDFVKKDVKAELALIEAHKGFAVSPIFHYEEDYSQYVPRGHYTRTGQLENYFKAFMWHGRMSMLLKGELIKSKDPEKDARIQTIQASMIASQLQSEPELLNNWSRIYEVTAFYVGFSDDLGPYEYMDALDSVFGNGKRKFNETTVNALKTKLAEYESPKIYGGTGNCVLEPPFTSKQADECLENTTGFRFMGQRFIPDSYVFSNLVGVYTGKYEGIGEYTDENKTPFTLVISEIGPIRGFPRGLDAVALLGSKRAVYWLDELNDSSYENYTARYVDLNSEFSNFNAVDWNRDLYWSWLYSLQPLLKDYGTGYPTFMQTNAWQDKELNTALSSWTELRHDTILYAKQSEGLVGSAGPGESEEKPAVGYVEPIPDFYARLLALTKMTKQGLSEMEVLNPYSENNLASLEDILTKLQKISEKELKNEELTNEEYEFIKNFGNQLEDTNGADDDVKKTTIIADVHTDGNSGDVLEEGVGYVDMLVVAYKLPDGRILLGAGPVMSHYEFKQPMSNRLTDEKWREMLEENPPKSPEWVSTYVS